MVLCAQLAAGRFVRAGTPGGSGGSSSDQPGDQHNQLRSEPHPLRRRHGTRVALVGGRALDVEQGHSCGEGCAYGQGFQLCSLAAARAGPGGRRALLAAGG